jgi:hypothetical protein
MPNEVYLRAYHGLTSLVSAKAATRLLNATLRSRRHSPESVDGELMSRLLLGPILRELESILPQDGLRHHLGRLAQQLRRLHTAPSAEAEALPLPEAVVYFDKPTPTLPAALPAASEAALERFVLAFAHLDHVRQVAVLRQGGEVILARGEGVDLATLARLGLLGLKLLSRRGRLHTYYLAHSRGQLFLFSLGVDTIVVVGAPELTIGAVLATYARLKEEL